MYTCASASRATIKTVTFLYNGTGGLADLHVVNITEKLYPNASSMPIWGVEDSGLPYKRITPFWSLLSPEAARGPNITSISRDSFWLPGTTPILSSVVDSTMNIPGASFYNTIMAHIYTELLRSNIKSTFEEIHDYSGHAQFALYQKWLELGQTAARSADIINLIWTDIAANAVIGTRGWASQEPTSSMSALRDSESLYETPQVVLFERRIRYRIGYAAPAFLLLLLSFALMSTVAVLLIQRRTGLNRMRWFLNQTSLGRNFTALLYSEVTSQQSTRKSWSKNDARRVVTVALDKPYAGNSLNSDTIARPKEETVVSQRLINAVDDERS